MRKTRPIDLPEQSFEQPAHFLIDTIPQSTFSRLPRHGSFTSSSSTTPFADGNTSFDGSPNDTLPLVEAMEPAIASAPPRSPYAVRTSTGPQPIDKPFDRFVDPLQPHHQERSLGDEYLHVLTQQLTDDQLLQAAVDASNQFSNFHHFYSDEEYENNAVSSPPRQFGRRAEGRTRIVSITSETNSAGNQVYVCSHKEFYFKSLLTLQYILIIVTYSRLL